MRPRSALPLTLVLLALWAGCHPVTVPPRSPPVIRADTAGLRADTGVLVVPPGPERTEILPMPPGVPREFRGAWVTPVWGGEWPSRPGLAPDSQRAELVRLLDRAAALGLNAVVLHVRPAADALYATSRVPWSVYLTGVPGQAPDPWYDPLEFAVEEAHRRGLALHAWFNPFRASPPDRRVPPPPGSLAGRRPEFALTYGGQRWLDPGIPAVRQEVLADVLEVVERYDIDGVHLDDYFYPYIEQRAVRARVKSGGRTRTVTRYENIPFPDTASWRRYGAPAGFATRGAWRRANIDEFVAGLYREVKARKPWVAVGLSPFGIWRPGNPPGITGLDAYAEIYADARKWLREGWLDYLAPQLYWPVAGVQQRFARLDEWWRTENAQQRHIWPGLHTELETTGATGWAVGEIARQVETLRLARLGTGEAHGHVHFRLRSLLAARAAPTADRLRQASYRDAAVVPAFPWLDATAPAPPRVRALPAAPGSDPVLAVERGDSVPVRWWLLQVLRPGGEWRLSVHAGSLRTLVLAGAPADAVAAVTALGRAGVASAPAVVRATVLTEQLRP